MEKETYQDIKDELINKLLIILRIVVILAIVTSVLRFFQTGWQSSYTLHIITLPTILVVAYYRKTISTFFKTAILVLISILIAVFDFYNLGLYSSSSQYLMLAVLFSSVFIGRKMAIWIYAFGAIIITGFGILTINGVIVPTFNTSNYNTYTFSWVNALVSFLLILGLIILIVGNIGQLLNSKIIELKRTNDELQKVLLEIKTLKGLLPICSFCKKILDDKGNWQQLETYVRDRTEANFSHGLCPECKKIHYPNVFK